MGGVLSAESRINIGVPQGSVLGPILFLIYINDLPSIHEKAKFTIFADDTTAACEENSLEGAEVGMNDLQSRVQEWFDMNLLHLNADKTSKIIFTLRQGVPKDLTVKFLGVQLDPLLQWHSQIDAVASRLRSIVYALRCLAACSSENALRTAYFGLFHPVSTYAILAWGHAPQMKRLFALQRRAIRILGRVGYRDDCRHIFKAMGILTLPSVYILENLLWVQKNHDQYTSHEDLHNYETRNKNKLVPLYQRLTRCQSGPGFLAVKLYNKILILF